MLLGFRRGSQLLLLHPFTSLNLLRLSKNAPAMLHSLGSEITPASKGIHEPSLEENNEEEAAPDAGLKRKAPTVEEPLKKKTYAVNKGKEIALQSTPSSPSLPHPQFSEPQQHLVLKMVEGASAIGDPTVAETLARADYIIWLTSNLVGADEMIRTLQRDMAEGERVRESLREQLVDTGETVSQLAIKVEKLKEKKYALKKDVTKALQLKDEAMSSMEKSERAVHAERDRVAVEQYKESAAFRDFVSAFVVQLALALLRSVRDFIWGKYPDFDFSRHPHFRTALREEVIPLHLRPIALHLDVPPTVPPVPAPIAADDDAPVAMPTDELPPPEIL
ncbi:hypothetical protein NE237_010609 [Protea cynaroides]|uniref:Uncharacterized protein n=1 Tax=Protea cynaroides TaxID=273540 RepID=A0A9Q0R1Q8_9MAGN|nr:hypothetical protein NE237_010609 [Protea cynaroides]